MIDKVIRYCRRCDDAFATTEKSRKHFCCPQCAKQYKDEQRELTRAYAPQQKVVNVCSVCGERYYRGGGTQKTCNNHICSQLVRRVSGENKRASTKGLEATLVGREWLFALKYFDNCCAVCGQRVRLKSIHTLAMDHWIPINYDGDDNPGTVAGNIVPLCTSCNSSKHDVMPDIWLNRQYPALKADLLLYRIEKYFAGIRRALPNGDG